MTSLKYINSKPIEHFYLEEDGITYTEKTPEMKLKDGLITTEEYNKIIAEKRLNEYHTKTDSTVIELMRAYLNKNIKNLNKEEKHMLETINNKIAEIKKENPKQE